VRGDLLHPSARCPRLNNFTIQVPSEPDRVEEPRYLDFFVSVDMDLTFPRCLDVTDQQTTLNCNLYLLASSLSEVSAHLCLTKFTF